MIQLNEAERALLARVFETRPDLSRRGNPRLRPLSMYSSELKNLKQVATAVDLAAKGQPLAPQPGTAQRYGNTLSNLGLWEGGIRRGGRRNAGVSEIMVMKRAPRLEQPGQLAHDVRGRRNPDRRLAI